MTIYEVLERLIIGPPFRSDEEQAAIELIHELRDLNALGTVSGIDKTTHDCDPAPMFVTGSRAWITGCRICGKDMSDEYPPDVRQHSLLRERPHWQ